MLIISLSGESILSSTKSPGWLRGVTIGLGVLVIILSIYALAFPAVAFVSVIWILAIILFFVGIEKIITGIFLPKRSRWATIGLGILVLIFAGLAVAFPVATAFVVIIFIGIALLFNGIARVVEGMSGKHSGWSRAALIGVGILSIILSIAVMVSPVFGAVLAGIFIAIALLITGMQMVATGVAGHRMTNPVPDIDRQAHSG
jgi:uncharacterized membrane protein HdeD (DUF308 family)